MSSPDQIWSEESPTKTLLWTEKTMDYHTAMTNS